MKTLKFLYFYIVSFFLIVSCETEKIGKLDTTIETKSKNFVSKELAVTVANNFLQKINEDKNNQTNRLVVEKTILETLTFETMNDENAFYAVNYIEGGFVVVSADNRVSPIRAYSDEGAFSENIAEMPDPVVTWLEEEKKVIETLQTSVEAPKAAIQYEWNYLLNVIGNPGVCQNILIQKGPLLKTRWGQWSGYNNLIPFNCSNTSGKVPTGCVATAMAQVMKFHEYPTNYNWSTMPNNFGTTSTQWLMWDIGVNIGMNYTCDGSGAQSYNIPSTFINTFGYSNSIFGVYNPDIAVNQLTVNKPIILAGGRRRGGVYFPWNDYVNGHAWVCDGYKLLILRAPQPNGTCFNWGFRFLHMNWGWGDNVNNYNGWFNDNNFNPNGGDYNYGRRMVYNIIP
jgi:Peptidase C10 family/Spi protease inhibitor